MARQNSNAILVSYVKDIYHHDQGDDKDDVEDADEANEDTRYQVR